MRFLKKFLELLGGVGGIPLKYGAQRGDINATVAVPMAASTVLTNEGGRFITIDASGWGAITTSGAATVYGWVTDAAQTTSATAGATKCATIINADVVYRMPVTDAVTAGATLAAWSAILGKKLDVNIKSDIQYVSADHATVGHVVVVGYDPWVAAVATTAVAAITSTTGCRWVDVIINKALQAK